MSRSDSTPDYKLPAHTPKDLKQIRKDELRMSLEKLAEKMRCDPRTIQRYEGGDFPIPQEFIRNLEQLRLEKLEERARAIAKGRIDLSTFLIPGLQLVELRPIRKVAEKLHRMFVAVPKEPPPEGEQAPSSPAPDAEESGGAGQTVPLLLAQGRLPLPEGTVLVENVLSVEVETSESPTRSFSAVRGVPPPGHNTGQRMAVAQITQAPSASKARTRFALGIAMVASLVTGCLLSHRPPDESSAREPIRLPESYTDNSTNENAAMGTQPKRSSIKMPDKPYSWQKVAPCDKEVGEIDEGGGCYGKMEEAHPPCPEYTVEDKQGRCLWPIPAKQKKPSTVEPKK